MQPKYIHVLQHAMHREQYCPRVTPANEKYCSQSCSGQKCTVNMTCNVSNNCIQNCKEFCDEYSNLNTCTGVSTSFEVGGWKMKVGGCDEVRGQRPRGTRGVQEHAPPWEIFEIWSICDAFSSILAKKLRLLEHY